MFGSKSLAKKARMTAMAVAVLIQIAAFSSASQAAFVLTLDDPFATPGIDAIIADNMPFGTITALGVSTHSDMSGLLGVVQFTSNIGSAWIVNITTGLSKPILPANSRFVTQHLDSVNVSSNGPATLEIMLTDTDYTLPVAGRWNLRHLIGGTADGTVDADGFVDFANLEFGMGLSPGPLGPFGPGAFSDTEHLKVDNPAPVFSLTQIVTIVHTGDFQVTSFDSEMVARITEPATLSLFGLGLAGLGHMRRRRTS